MRTLSPNSPRIACTIGSYRAHCGHCKSLKNSIVTGASAEPSVLADRTLSPGAPKAGAPKATTKKANTIRGVFNNIDKAKLFISAHYYCLFDPASMARARIQQKSESRLR